MRTKNSRRHTTKHTACGRHTQTTHPRHRGNSCAHWKGTLLHHHHATQQSTALRWQHAVSHGLNPAPSRLTVCHPRNPLSQSKHMAAHLTSHKTAPCVKAAGRPQRQDPAVSGQDCSPPPRPPASWVFTREHPQQSCAHQPAMRRHTRTHNPGFKWPQILSCLGSLYTRTHTTPKNSQSKACHPGGESFAIATIQQAKKQSVWAGKQRGASVPAVSCHTAT
jgi:hypothetical protein